MGMSDRENVIERIHEAIDMGVCVDLFIDVLNLLKEQESIVEALKSDLDETLKVLGEQPEIVRCKDCIYLNADTGICIVGIPHGYTVTFYCAYGKRR